MGEVYRATDTTLDRQVAIKVLPDAFSGDVERLSRFEREAKVLASLNHPNIGAIYGLEKSGDTRALVLELVEGPTLADRIAQGPIPLDEALPIARQIAEALEAAHEQGVIHRDLKPANIKVRNDGTVKVLDFGLAKAQKDHRQRSDFASADTVTTTGTRVGEILGTAAYMSPEQARGTPVDHRADIWAFGCVLFEMLTGEAAFGRNTLTDTLAAVIEREPEWDRLPANVPETAGVLLRRCIEKDVTQRLPHIGAARLELADSAHPRSVAGAGQTAEGRARRVALVGGGAAVVLAGASLLWFATSESDLRQPAPVVSRLSVNPSPGERWVISPHDPDFAVSPDGQQIAYVGRRADESQLIVRRLDEFDGTALGSFGGALRNPFFSPTGEWVGFVDGNILRKVAIDSGEVASICELPGYMSGAAWGPDDTVIFGGWNGGLYKVSSDGGEPEPLTATDRARGRHQWPTILPDGKAVLYASASTGEAPSIRGRSLVSGEEKVVVENATFPRYVPTGHLLYVAAGALWAVALDVEELTAVGDAVQVVDGVLVKGRANTVSAADVGIGANGTLVFRPAMTAGGGTSTFVWVDRDGREEALAFEPRAYGHMVLSPDGSAVAVEITADDPPNPDIWVGDVTGSALTQLTFNPGLDVLPLWTKDGRFVLFGSRRGGAGSIYRKRVDGRSEAEALLPVSTSVARRTDFVTPDGDSVVYAAISRDGSRETEFRQLSLTGDGADQPVPLEEGVVPAISPDGRWMAYISQETGDFEV